MTLSLVCFLDKPLSNFSVRKDKYKKVETQILNQFPVSFLPLSSSAGI